MESLNLERNSVGPPIFRKAVELSSELHDVERHSS